MPHPLITDETPSNSASSTITPLQLQQGLLAHLTPGLPLSPTLTEILLPFDRSNPEHQDFVHYQLPEGFQLPYSDDECDPTKDIDEEEIEKILRTDEIVHGPLPLLDPLRLNSPKSGMSYVFRHS